MSVRLNPGELEIELFCRGVRIGPSCTLETDARAFSRTRAGLGSGLELVLPGDLRDVWLNAPVLEHFVKDSPFELRKEAGGYGIADTRTGLWYPVRLPPAPAWYFAQTSTGIPMDQIGVLQGTYLGIYINESCGFWGPDQLQCKFCTTGLNVGTTERAVKCIEDVVEVAQAAIAQSGVTFIHFNSGYQGGKDLERAAPYAAAIKEQAGALVGLQLTPSAELWKYDWLIDLGVDHFSFCYELHDPAWFARILPGKTRTFGQEGFFRALEYTAAKLGKGAVSGEIIAGIEPVEATLAAIDYITERGAFPTVCIFRPTQGSQMEDWPSPDPDEMKAVFRHVYEACRRHGIPIGLAPNIEVSLVVQPTDTKYLAPRDLAWHLYEAKLKLMQTAAQPLFARKLRKQRLKADPRNPLPYMPATARSISEARSA